MSVLGIDIGNDLCVIAQAKRGGVDVILNEGSKRLTPALVSFVGKERMIGEAAVSQLRSNYKNTVTQVKRLIGRKFSDPLVQADLAEHLHFKVEELAGDEIGIKVNYNDEVKVLTPVQVMGSLLTKLRMTAEAANPGTKASDVVLSVPAYFTDAERHAMRDAATVAGLNCLRLLNESEAVALSYGLYKSAKGEFNADESTKVCLLDMGHSGFTVTIAAYVTGKLTILSCVSDRHTGGRDIDVAVAKHLAGVFKSQTGIDCWGNPKSRIKLMGAAEKSKKTLSPHGVNQVAVNVEYVAEERDLATKLELEDFDAAAAPVVARVAAPIEKAMAEAGIASAKEFSAIEIVGGGLRPRCIKAKIAEALGVEVDDLRTTLNMDECVARGCALQCAMLSPLFRVKDFEMVGAVPYPVRITWEQTGAGGGAEQGFDVEENGEGGGGGDEAKSDDSNSIVIFKRGDATPFSRRVTFRRSEPFTLEAAYDDNDTMPLPSHIPRSLGKFKVLGVTPGDSGEDGAAPKIRVYFDHTKDGTFAVSGAQQLKEVKAPPAPAPAVAAADGSGKATGDEAPAVPPATDSSAKPEDGDDAPMDGDGSAAPEGGDAAADGAGAAADGAAAGGDGGDATPAADGSGSGDATPAAAGADGSGENAEKKKKFKRVSLQVEVVAPGLTQHQLQEFVETELSMAQQDRIIQETQAVRNELEGYVYDMRSAVNGPLSDFIAPDDKDTFLAKLEEVENWLYEDGFDCTRSVYSERLSGLKAFGDPVHFRASETEKRPEATSKLLRVCEDYKRVVNSTEELYAHLTDEDRAKMRDQCVAAEEWLQGKLADQSGLSLNQDPVLTVAAINDKINEVDRECRPIANKPKPPPPAPEPTPEEKKDGQGEGEGEGDKAAAEEGDAKAAADAANNDTEAADKAKADDDAKPEDASAAADDAAATPKEGDVDMQ